MKYNTDKVDEMVLALLFLTTFKVDTTTRAWKSYDWDTLRRWYEKGYISNPKSKARSVALTEDGVLLSKELFERYCREQVSVGISIVWRRHTKSTYIKHSTIHQKQNYHRHVHTTLISSCSQYIFYTI